jgi:hypothetical protein
MNDVRYYREEGNHFKERRSRTMAGRVGISDEERLRRLKKINWDKYREEMDIHNLLEIFSYRSSKEAIIQMIENGQLKAYSAVKGNLIERKPGETRKAARLVFFKKDVRETVEKFITGEYTRKRGGQSRDHTGDAYSSYLHSYYERKIKPQREAEKQQKLAAEKNQGEQAVVRKSENQ